MRSKFALLLSLLLVATAALLGACGDDEEAQASDTDGAFLAGMVPHHQSAIEMAEVARAEAEHAEVGRLADAIVTSQSEEIEQIEAIHERLFDEPVGEMDHPSMGLDARMMGMDMKMSMLEDAKPFDRQFIDMMIPHHQGAIRMSQIELEEGEDDETKALAEEVIAAQSREIEQMNGWRDRWYGSPSPAGGVPDADDTMGAMGGGMGMPGMEH